MSEVFSPMRRVLSMLAVASGLAMAPASGHAADVLAACEADIAQYCGAVEPGHGRVMACLYAHETVVGDACDAAIADTADMLDMLFETLTFARQECAADIESLCGDVPAGEGRILTCLKSNEVDLSDGCGAIMSSVTLPDAEEGDPKPTPKPSAK